MKLTSMQKMLGVVAAIVVVLIAAVVLLVVPKFSELAQLDVELQAAKDQVDQTKALLAQLDQARSNAALTQAELLALANQMPENPELPSLLIELQDVSNTAGVRFNRVVVPGDPARQVGGHPRLPPAHQRHDSGDPRHAGRFPAADHEREHDRDRGARSDQHAGHQGLRDEPARPQGARAARGAGVPDAALVAPRRTDTCQTNLKS
jgi:hypothetical protein